MSIRAVCGRPGSGKSLFLVSKVLRPSSLDNRVLTVFGMDGLQVPHDRMGDEHLQKTAKGHYLPKLEFLRSLKPGSILVIDEAHKVFGAGSGTSMGADLRDWFARHRHYTDEQGRPMDIWVAVQDPMQLTSQFKALVDEWYHFKRLTTIGTRAMSAMNVWEGPPGDKGSCRMGFKIVKDDKSSYKYYKSTVGTTSGATDVSRYDGGRLRFWASIAIFGLVGTGIWAVLTSNWLGLPGSGAAERAASVPIQPTSYGTKLLSPREYAWHEGAGHVTITLSPGVLPEHGRYPTWKR